MKALRYRRHGAPHEVLELVEDQDVDCGPFDAKVLMLASPVDPMDLLLIRGLYPVRAPLPATAGAEGVGRVVEVGAAVEGVARGDRALLPVRHGAWRTQVTLPATELLPLPRGVDPVQASMLRVNPLTADVLLSESVPLRPGEWVIHSPGAGSVGQYLIQLAKLRSLRSVSVVRRPGREAWLEELGTDLVVPAGAELAQRVREGTGGAQIRLAIDGVGGSGSRDLASCVADGGTLVSYGAMSREPPALSLEQVVFRDVKQVGFWLLRWAQQVGREQVDRRVAGLAKLGLRSQLAACYSFEAWSEAIEHAQRDDRDGRVVFVPDATGAHPA